MYSLHMLDSTDLSIELYQSDSLCTDLLSPQVGLYIYIYIYLYTLLSVLTYSPHVGLYISI